MAENEFLSLLTLQHIPHLGDGSIKKLIQHFGSAEAVLQQKKEHLLKVEGIGEHKLQSFWDEKHSAFAKAELEHLQTHKIHYSCYTDNDYPQRLKHCIDGPVVLFQKGNIKLEQRKIISIVGTRKITSYGTAFVEKLIEEIAPFNPIIVSGFAYGVDITAHKAALKNNLQTIGVLAHGLDKMYPKTHSKYVKDVEKNGGFMTDFWTSDSFVHTNFLQRNRIIAGLSEATIVIESAAKGGSLVTTDFANGYHRDVFAVPGRATDPLSIGCNNLIKQHKAHVLTSAADIAYILNWKLEEEAPLPVQKKLFVTLEEDEKLIWSFLKKHGKEELDIIALHCKMPTHKIAGILLTMELKGVIRPLPGKLFEVM
ncbi:DNA-processing protein DprA [uncultured Dokdonia sp.]|uniref:DNA-processing protein DprA n=1 Tax=uncultured Dokdonia sp. TaxID=575653 RepID=UPI00262C793F|nr:DNA-processing protein DprA [uncultured Dokdonia sp.]